MVENGDSTKDGQSNSLTKINYFDKVDGYFAPMIYSYK